MLYEVITFGLHLFDQFLLFGRKSFRVFGQKLYRRSAEGDDKNGILRHRLDIRILQGVTDQRQVGDGLLCVAGARNNFV